MPFARAQAFSCDALEGFDTAFAKAQKSAGPTLIHMRIAPGSMSPLGRPTITPQEVAQRFKSFIADKSEQPLAP